MAFVRNVKKTSRVVGALKQMKSTFLSKLETQILFCRKTRFVFENYKGIAGNQPLHPNSILRKQCHTLTSISYPPVSHCCTAKFHYLAENALVAWAMSNKNAEVTFKFPGPESISGMRSYAKDVDSKESPPLGKKKDSNPLKVDDTDCAARFAEAKRILKEKRMSKGLEYQKKSPFEEP